METNNTNTVRGSILSRVRTAAAECGLSFEVVTVADAQGGRTMYILGGCKPVTPGQAAHILGVE